MQSARRLSSPEFRCLCSVSLLPLASQSDVTPNYEELGEPSSQPPALPSSLTCALAAKRCPRSAPQASGRAVSAWRGPGRLPPCFRGSAEQRGQVGLHIHFIVWFRVSHHGHACPTEATCVRQTLCGMQHPRLLISPVTHADRCVRSLHLGQLLSSNIPPAQPDAGRVGNLRLRPLRRRGFCWSLPRAPPFWLSQPRGPRWFPRRLNRKAHTGQVYRVLGAAPFPGAASAGEVSAPLLSADHEDTGPAAHAAQRLSGRSSLLHQLPGPSGSFLSGEGPCDPSSQDEETGRKSQPSPDVRAQSSRPSAQRPELHTCPPLPALKRRHWVREPLWSEGCLSPKFTC